MVTQVDDFCYGGNREFFGKVIDILKETLRIGEEKEKNFNYLGVNIEGKGNHGSGKLY